MRNDSPKLARSTVEAQDPCGLGATAAHAIDEPLASKGLAEDILSRKQVEVS